MALEEVKARLEGQDAVAVEYDFGADLDEAIGLFGATLVHAKFRAAAIIDLQSFMRGHLRKDPPSSQEDLDAAVEEWRPGMKARGKTVDEKVAALLKDFTEDERAAIIEKALLAGGEEEE